MHALITISSHTPGLCLVADYSWLFVKILWQTEMGWTVCDVHKWHKVSCSVMLFDSSNVFWFASAELDLDKECGVNATAGENLWIVLTFYIYFKTWYYKALIIMHTNFMFRSFCRLVVHIWHIYISCIVTVFLTEFTSIICKKAWEVAVIYLNGVRWLWRWIHGVKKKESQYRGGASYYIW